MSTYDMSTCRDVLSSKRLSDVLQSQHVVTVRSSSSVDQTLRVGCIDLIVYMCWYLVARLVVDGRVCGWSEHQMLFLACCRVRVLR